MGMLMPFFDLISSAMVIGDFLLHQKMAQIYTFWLRRCRVPVLIPWCYDTAWHSLTSM
jgi:hypothetical protein